MTQTIDEELLVKSRHRVKAHGEVFTPRRMVDQMLDLVSEGLETGPEFVDKTVLEPAAGRPDHRPVRDHSSRVAVPVQG